MKIGTILRDNHATSITCIIHKVVVKTKFVRVLIDKFIGESRDRGAEGHANILNNKYYSMENLCKLIMQFLHKFTCAAYLSNPI